MEEGRDYAGGEVGWPSYEVNARQGAEGSSESRAGSRAATPTPADSLFVKPSPTPRDPYITAMSSAERYAYPVRKLKPTLLSVQTSGISNGRSTPSPTSAASEPWRRVDTPTDHIPEPYLPLRKSASQRLRQRSATPVSSPLNEAGFPRAEQPSPTTSVFPGRPRLLSAARSREDGLRDTISSQSSATSINEISEDELIRQGLMPWGRARGQTTSYGSSQQPRQALRYSTSIPNLSELRNRNGPSTTYKPYRGRPHHDTDSGYGSILREPHLRKDPFGDEARSSYRSAWTNNSSGFIDASETERSSVITKRSSVSDALQQGEEGEEEEEEFMSTEDFIGMYADGFNDEPSVEDGQDISDEGYASQAALAPSIDAPEEPPGTPKRPSSPNKRSASPMQFGNPGSPTKRQVLSPPIQRHVSNPIQTQNHPAVPVPRDHYGFKKATQNVTVAQYDMWNAGYTEYTARRRKKWVQLMKSNGLDTIKPVRFPPRSDKVKRYIRKGIPPEWRGAAWFWYSGGPEKAAENPGLYWELIEQVNNGKLSDLDREHIERDLHRTFPDNIRFKPDRPASVDTSSLLSGRTTPLDQDTNTETPILRSLRRVLQAFAVHNPSIGYCQSLNFLAGLLLLFLDEDEEKTFIILDIITTAHLPGTHGKILEANVDIGVLMSCIRESMPHVWAKIDDQSQHHHDSLAAAAMGRLPTVSLATTSWFMSLFVGNLPIETVLRVWDSFFYEGSKTLFRIALAIFKLGEPEIRTISDHMEIFQVVQTIPRRLVDANVLMEACFRRRNGFGHLSQETIDARRAERRRLHAQDMARLHGGRANTEAEKSGLRRVASKAGRFKRSHSRKRGKDKD